MTPNWRHEAAAKGHTFQCDSCGLTRDYIGALINHIRAIHQRKPSLPEYMQVTTRQARDFQAMLKARPGATSPRQ